MTNKNKRKGKVKFILIDGYVIRSEAWKNLTPNDRATYLVVKWTYDGLNNGRIGLGCREVAASIGVSKDTANRSLISLQDKGFIVMMKASGFNIKNRNATEWRLTEYACNVTGELATKDFARWTLPEKSTVSPEGHTVASQGQWSEKRRLKSA